MPFEWPRRFTASARDQDAALILASLHSLHASRLVKASQRLRTASAVLAAVRRGEAASEADQERARSADAAELRDALDVVGARAVFPHMPEYPRSLFALADPPLSLFVRGRSLDQMVPGVAIIGARSCSPSGKDIAAALGRGLARAGITVVSGAARGIDIAAQEATVAIGGATVAVLGSGIDVHYPRSSAPTLAEVARQGTIVSEYLPGVSAEPYRFPARNRLVAGLSCGVVIVEGAGRSGTLITVDLALQIGRTVYAVPGPITSPLSEVPLGLIREGARPIRGIDDLLLDLGETQGSAALPAAVLNEEEAAVLAVLHGPTLPESLVDALGWDLGKVMRMLLHLELRGLVAGHGGRFEPRIREG